MSENDEVDRDVVIAVLRANGVEVHGQEEGPADMVVLTKGDKIEGQRLPQMVKRKMVRYLARKYGIPVDKFYLQSLGSSETPA